MAKPKQEPCAWISLWEGGEYPRPALKGVLKFNIEDMKAILNAACQADPDDYDQYSLDVALWEEENGGGNYPVMKGKLSVRQEREQKTKAKRSNRGSRRR